MLNEVVMMVDSGKEKERTPTKQIALFPRKEPDDIIIPSTIADIRTPCK